MRGKFILPGWKLLPEQRKCAGVLQSAFPGHTAKRQDWVGEIIPIDILLGMCSVKDSGPYPIF